MPRKRAWLTPDSPAPDVFRGRCFSVPDDVQLVGAVTGALIPLTQPENWEPQGSMTPDEAAEIMSTAFEAFVSGDCESGGGGGECDIGTAYTLMRRNGSGETEVWDGDEWVTPVGDYAIPNPDARPEEDEYEQKCGAASNAADVLKTLYESFQTIWEEEVDPAIQKAELASSIAVSIGAVFGPISETFLVLNEYFWAVMGAASEVIGTDGWSDEWHTELTCILNHNLEITDGVAHFNYVGFHSELVGFILPVIDEYVVLRWMVYYLSLVLGSEGLDAAGAVQNVEGDCADCDEWCVNLTPGEWGDALTIVYGTMGGDGFVATQDVGGTKVAIVTLTIDTDETTIKRIGCTVGNMTYPTYANVFAYHANATPNYPTPWIDTGNIQMGGDNQSFLSVDNVSWGSLPSTSTPSFRLYAPLGAKIKALKLTGTGKNPFGIGSNC